MKRITVLLADDHMVLREGLRALLDLDGGFAIVGEAADGLRAVELARERRPDVAVLDIAMPLLNGLDAARRILQEAPTPPKVLILSAHADDVYVEQVAALGVSGYLVKQSSAHMLARAIRTVHSGGTFYSPAVAKRLPGEGHGTPRRARATKRGLRALTSREREVLQRVAEGQANKRIAADLGISIKTVEKHRQSLMRKLDLHDTAGITRYAISAGIIESCVQCTIA
jgi:DNA-binding NarL/FixJ family response regulator